MTEPRFLPARQPVSVSKLSFGQVARSLIDASSETIAALYGSAGAGKTSVLKARFLHLVNQGLGPEQVLVIAATRDSANLYRDELALELQRATAGPVAKTLASFAFAILTERARLAGKKPPTLVSGSEQDQILSELLKNHEDSLWPKQLDKTVRSLVGFRTELRDLIAVALEHGISPAQLEQFATSEQLPQWQGASDIYKKYLAELNQFEVERFDSSSLLRAAAGVLANQDSEAGGHQGIRCVLVDDAQELTPAAAELIFQLAKKGAGVCLFGDPDVATLGFRVANPKTMSDLVAKIAATRNEGAQQLYLEPTHRVRSGELSKALSKISSQIEVAKAGRQRKALSIESETEAGSNNLEVKVFRSESDEADYLANFLRKRHLFDGVAWNQMAVVARSRPDLDSLALALSARSVPVRVLGSRTALKSEHAAGQLLELAEIALSDAPLDASEISKLLLLESCGLDGLGLIRLKRAIKKAADDPELSGDELLVEAFYQPNTLSLLRLEEARKAERFIRVLNETKQLANQQDQSAEAVLWSLISGTSLLDRWQIQSRGVSEISLQAGKNLDSMMALFAAAARFTERNPKAKPIDFVKEQLAREIPEDTLALNDFFGNQVLLLTPAGLIGRRFDTVAIPGLIEGRWPNLKPRSSLLGAQLLDGIATEAISKKDLVLRSELYGELRMFNKAVGAASQKLIISATEKEDEQISQFVALVHGQISEPETKIPRSLTLRSLVGDLRRQLASGSAENPQEIALGLARLKAAAVPGADPRNWYGLLPISTSEPLTDLENEKVKIRPSQLENFLKCPLHWFLESHGGKSDSFSASLGTLIHEVLETSSSSELAELERLTESRWHSLEFEADWLEKLSKRQAGRMLANLASYLQQFEKAGGRVLAKEQNFSFEFGSIGVNGQVDRIEQYPDGSIVVVDLKTSRQVPTEKQTELNPQLALYQMALLEGGFEKLGPISQEQLAGAKLLIVSSDRYQERNQLALNQQSSDEFKNLLLETSEGMARPVFLAQLSSHCEADREYGSCKLQLTRAVSYAN